MMSTAVTRRAFLATSTGAVTTAALAARLEAIQEDSRPAPDGVVYGRVGRRGISPGTASHRSRGEVVLLDGRVLEVTHVTSQGIAAGKSVLLSPDGSGGWSILYAEL